MMLATTIKGSVMWDDVIIGSGHKGNSAIMVGAIGGDHNISENRYSYWIADAYLGAGITIFKDTEEGQHLTKLIKDGIAIYRIEAWLEDLLIANIDPVKLKLRVKEAMENSYREGRRDRAAEIREALGIR